MHVASGGVGTFEEFSLECTGVVGDGAFELPPPHPLFADEPCHLDYYVVNRHDSSLYAPGLTRKL